MLDYELRDIPGFEGLYAVTQDGRIWSYKRKIFLKDRADKDGYRRITLMLDGERKTRQVHRLVALAWIDNPDNLPQINHKDEDKTNNNVYNLEWCDSKYNNNYGTKSGRAGEKNSKPVRCVETGEVFPSFKAAAASVNVDRSGISMCVRGITKTCGKYHWELVKEN